jgi:uncharacterized protein YehS (DUF1456 family)
METDQNKNQISQACQVKYKTTKELATDVLDEYKVLCNLLTEAGFTGIEDNFRIREKLNGLIHEMRKIQDLLIKIKAKSSKNNIITKKLKNLTVDENNVNSE